MQIMRIAQVHQSAWLCHFRGQACSHQPYTPGLWVMHPAIALISLLLPAYQYFVLHLQGSAPYTGFDTPVGGTWASGLPFMSSSLKRERENAIKAGVRLDLAHVDVNKLKVVATLADAFR